MPVKRKIPRVDAPTLDVRARVRNKVKALDYEIGKLPDVAIGALLRSGVLDEAITSVRALAMLGRVADVSIGEVVGTLTRHVRRAILK